MRTVGLLPAFLGTGMIPLVLTELFGIKRRGLVIVPLRLWRATFIDFQMNGEGEKMSVEGRQRAGTEGKLVGRGEYA